MIQIKLGEYSRDYSYPLDLDIIGDISLKIPINEEMKQMLIKRNIVEKKQKNQKGKKS